MKTPRTKIIALALAGLLSVALPALNADSNRKSDDNARFNQLPKACQAYLHHSFGDQIQILEVEKERENGVNAYEIELLLDRREIKLKLTADGKLLASEEHVAYSDLPEAVKKSIDWKPESKLAIRVTAVTPVGGSVIYEVEIEGRRGKQFVDAQGRTRGSSAENDLD